MSPFIIFAGESNSGGYALNTELPAQSPRPVKILNNTSLVFEDLHIGVNNLIGHAGLSNGTHGWEHGLALAVEAGSLADVHLVKTGQGGSVIADWTGSNMTTLKARVGAAKALMKAAGKTPLPFVWYSQGINDAIAGTPVETWKAATVAHFKALRAVLGFCPIITCKFPATYTAYNAALASIQDPWLFIVESSDAGLRDANHWNAAGMALIASRMVEKTLSVGVDLSYLLSADLALYGVAPASAPPPTGWHSMQNASSPSTGVIQNNGTLPSGGVMAFTGTTFTLDYDAATEDTAILALDNDGTASYGWPGAGSYLSGVYSNGGILYLTTLAGSAVNLGNAPAFPFKIRATISGTNLVYELFTAGAWGPLYTHVGVVTTSTLWLKAIIAAVGKKIKLVL